MTLDALIMLLGTFVAILPFLGFPNSWDTIMLLVAGILLVVLGIVVRRRLARKNGGSLAGQAGPHAHASAEKSSLDPSRHEPMH
ncbi:MAG: hypothetical protein G01um10148_274 [Parcubacteria group bacterium Gr01-1014_8]|nr:MAG: hypothetical protein G01um10148_274 [Parcubacteria group bacterium Gr01-1014_8]